MPLFIIIGTARSVRRLKLNMRIYSWNVNGIRSAEKKGFNDWFKKTQPELLCLQETRAELNQVPEEIQAPEGYFCYWNACQKKKDEDYVFPEHLFIRGCGIFVSISCAPWCGSRNGSAPGGWRATLT